MGSKHGDNSGNLILILSLSTPEVVPKSAFFVSYGIYNGVNKANLYDERRRI